MLLQAAEEEVASKISILNKIWDTCLDLILDHPRANPEVIRTRLHTRFQIEHSYHRFRIHHTKVLEVQL